jgi:hypothetical protein
VKYKPKWRPLVDALDLILSGPNRDGTLDEAENELTAALLDGEVKSRWTNTGEAIDPNTWRNQAKISFFAVVVRGWPAAGLEDYETEVEVCWEDVERIWGPTPSAAQLSDAGSPVDAAVNRSDSIEAHRGATCTMPRVTKVPNQAAALEPQKRGPDPKKRKYVERRIQEDLDSGYYASLEQLNKTPRKEIYYRYCEMPGCEKPLVRDTVMRALRNVVEGHSVRLPSAREPRQIPTNDKFRQTQ